jgi:phage baseplate assembly protein W
MSIFSDINLYTGEISHGELVFDSDDIRQSILTILTTDIGSRLFRPDFGSNLQRLLFDPLTSDLTTRLRSDIYASIGKWEPRVTIEFVDISMDKVSASFRISVQYRVPALNNVRDSLAFALQSRL